MRSEKEIKSDLSYIANSSTGRAEVLERAGRLLAREIDGTALFVYQRGGVKRIDDASIARLLDSRDFPLRSLYVAPLAVNGREAGRLIACFAAFDAPGEVLRSLTAHAANEFKPLLAREFQQVSAWREVA